MVSRSVHALMVHRRHESHSAEGIRATEDPFDVVDVQAHAFEIAVSEWARRGEHVARDTETADVMDKCSASQQSYFVVGDLE